MRSQLHQGDDMSMSAVYRYMYVDLKLHRVVLQVANQRYIINNINKK